MPSQSAYIVFYIWWQHSWLWLSFAQLFHPSTRIKEENKRITPRALEANLKHPENRTLCALFYLKISYYIICLLLLYSAFVLIQEQCYFSFKLLEKHIRKKIFSYGIFLHDFPVSLVCQPHIPQAYVNALIPLEKDQGQ